MLKPETRREPVNILARIRDLTMDAQHFRHLLLEGLVTALPSTTRAPQCLLCDFGRTLHLLARIPRKRRGQVPQRGRQNPPTTCLYVQKDATEHNSHQSVRCDVGLPIVSETQAVRAFLLRRIEYCRQGDPIAVVDLIHDEPVTA